MNIIKILFPDQLTSHETPAYNCIAWAAGDNKRWWDPDESCYWPPGVPRLYTAGAHIKAFEAIGFLRCADGDFEENFIKIALFVKEEIEDGYIKTTYHAARQIYNGRWTSKCGKSFDIVHDLNQIFELYGDIFCYMKRPA